MLQYQSQQYFRPVSGIMKFQPKSPQQQYFSPVSRIKQLDRSEIPQNFQTVNKEYLIKSPQDTTVRLQSQNKYLDLNQNYQNYLPSPEREDQINLVEKRITVLVNENKSINQLLTEKMVEFDRIKTQNADQLIELNRLRGLEHEILLTKDLCELRQKECGRQRFRANQLEAEGRHFQIQLNEQISITKAVKLELLQWKSRFVELDQERLRQLEVTRASLQHLREQEIEHASQKYEEQTQQLEMNQAREVDEQNRIQLVKDELNKQKLEVTKLQIYKNSKLEAKNKDYVKLGQQLKSDQKIQSKVNADLQDSNKMNQEMIQDIERLNGIITDRNQENDQFRDLLEQTAQQILKIQNKNSDLSGENKRLRDEVERLNQQFKSLRNQFQKSANDS